MEREFKIRNATVTGRIRELVVGVEGGQTHLVVKFLKPPDISAVCGLEHVAHLAVHRIEILAGGGLHPRCGSDHGRGPDHARRFGDRHLGKRRDKGRLSASRKDPRGDASRLVGRPCQRN